VADLYVLQSFGASENSGLLGNDFLHGLFYIVLEIIKAFNIFVLLPEPLPSYLH
jgi:hypothetical protein